MQRRTFENSRKVVDDRGADGSAPRSTPLTLVSGAVAGGDLRSVAGAAAEAIGCAVAIAIPALGEPVVCPAEALPADHVQAIQDYAVQVVADGEPAEQGAAITGAVAVRIGEQTVGVVAAVACPHRDLTPERVAWLEAAAAAASVTALIRSDREAMPDDSERALLEDLVDRGPQDIPSLLQRARRLGFDLGAGAVALCGRWASGAPGSQGAHPVPTSELGREAGVLLGQLADGRVVGLAPLGPQQALEMAQRLRAHGMTVALSAPRRTAEGLREALREAELLVDPGIAPDVTVAGLDETYRLLIGVLLRDPEELARLRERTISPLAAYDAQHDTDLLETLKAFLAHDGSTTETAEALTLHRHTVGYRLSRVHEVSGLSPYESDGRERLSLGLKADQILDAAVRLALPVSNGRERAGAGADGDGDGDGDGAGSSDEEAPARVSPNRSGPSSPTK